MDTVLKIFLVSFALIVFTIGCGGSKEEVEFRYYYCGNHYYGKEIQLRKGTITAEFSYYTTDTISYVHPQIIRGLDSFVSKISYPEIAKRSGVEGIVYVDFEVTVIGRVDSIKLRKEIGGGCEEALINELKKQIFIPAKKNNIPVKESMAIRSIFRLE